MHYAVPQVLHRHSLLRQLYTDICGHSGWWRVLRYLPPAVLPPSLARLSSRVPTGVPKELITEFPRFGLEYKWRLKVAANPQEVTEAHLWAGERFCELIRGNLVPDAAAFYGFNSASLELLLALGERGFFRVVEQTIAPRRVERRIMEREEIEYPDWQPSGRRDGALGDYMRREEQEWQHSELIVCGSQFVKDGIRECNGPAEKCVVVPYGVDLGDFGPRDRKRRADRPLRILTVGEVCLRKGSHYVLSAARALGSRAHFRMVGPMNLLPGKAKELRQHIEWLGVVPRNQMARQFGWGDVFLLPSLCEGSATVTYEALSAGLPLVVTASTGSVVEDGVSGFCVPERDVDAIVEALTLLSERDSLLEGMTRAARERAEYASVRAYGERLRVALTANDGSRGTDR